MQSCSVALILAYSGARIAAAVTLRPDLPRGLVHKLIYEDTTLDLYRPVTKEWLQMVDAIRLASGLGLSTRELMDAALSKSIGVCGISCLTIPSLP